MPFFPKALHRPFPRALLFLMCGCALPVEDRQLVIVSSDAEPVLEADCWILDRKSFDRSIYLDYRNIVRNDGQKVGTDMASLNLGDFFYARWGDEERCVEVTEDFLDQGVLQLEHVAFTQVLLTTDSGEPIPGISLMLWAGTETKSKIFTTVTNAAGVGVIRWHSVESKLLSPSWTYMVPRLLDGKEALREVPPGSIEGDQVNITMPALRHFQFDVKWLKPDPEPYSEWVIGDENRVSSFDITYPYPRYWITLPAEGTSQLWLGRKGDQEHLMEVLVLPEQKMTGALVVEIPSAIP